MSERISGAPSGSPSRQGRPTVVDVFDTAVLDRTLDEDWSRYTGPAVDVRARGLRIRRARRFRSLLSVAGTTAVTVMVVGFAPCLWGASGPGSPAAGAAASGSGSSELQMTALMAAAPTVGEGVVDGHDWMVRVRIFKSRGELEAQAPGIDGVIGGSSGPVALIANYHDGKLGSTRDLKLTDSPPTIPDGEMIMVDARFPSEYGLVAGQVGAAVDVLRVTAAGREKDYRATSIDGYRFVALPVSAAEPVTQIVAVDRNGRQIGSVSGRFIPYGVFGPISSELPPPTPAKKG